MMMYVAAVSNNTLAGTPCMPPTSAAVVLSIAPRWPFTLTAVPHTSGQTLTCCSPHAVQQGSLSLVAAAALLGGVLAWGYSSRRSEHCCSSSHMPLSGHETPPP